MPTRGAGADCCAPSTSPEPTIARVHGAPLRRRRRAESPPATLAATPGGEFAADRGVIGLIPAVIAPYAVRAMGDAAARRWFLTVRASPQSCRSNLIHAVVAGDPWTPDRAWLTDPCRARRRWAGRQVAGRAAPAQSDPARSQVDDRARSPRCLLLGAEGKEGCRRLPGKAQAGTGPSAHVQIRPGRQSRRNRPAASSAPPGAWASRPSRSIPRPTRRAAHVADGRRGAC